MKIIGIDFSMTSTGVVVQDIEKTIFHSRKVTPPKEVRQLEVQYHHIAKEIIGIIEPTDLVIVEQLIGGTNFHSNKVLSGLHAVFNYLLYMTQQNIPIRVYPTTLKKFVCDSKAKKDQMRLAVFKKYGREFETHDEVDAFVLSEIGLALLNKSSVPITNKMQECLKSVSKNVPKEHILKSQLFF